MSIPKVSVIVPVYNNEEFLETCLNSIICQTLKDIEILCIDDGSTDNSLDILNKFKNMDNRIRLFSQENSGAGVARNVGIENSKGEYIIFVDGDDWIEDSLCHSLYNQSKNLDSDMILFNAIEHKPNNEYSKRTYFPNDSFKKDINSFTFNYKFRKNLVLNGMFVIWSKFYKSSFLKRNNILFENHMIFNDVQFHIKTMLYAKRIGYCPKSFYNYNRLNSTSLQNSVSKTKKTFILFKLFHEIKEFLEENNFMDYFKLNFFRFVITESMNNLEKVHSDFKPEFFGEIKKFFEYLDLSSQNLNGIPINLYKFYIWVLNSDSYVDYLYFKNVDGNSLSNQEYLLLNKITEKNHIIQELNGEIQSLKEDYQILSMFHNDYLDNPFLFNEIRKKAEELSLFDEEYYIYHEFYGGDIDPYVHYLYKGYKEGRNPSELFDSKFYSTYYGLENDFNPLIYFLTQGLDEGKYRIKKDIRFHDSVNRNDVDFKISSFCTSGVTKTKRNPQLIVSLTSYPKRMNFIKYSLYSLMTQNLKPDKIVLWLAEEEFPNGLDDIPDDVLKFTKWGLEIMWCENIKSYKKLIPSLREFPDDLIVTVDDDIFLPKDWLEKLYSGYLKSPNDIICQRARNISFNSDGSLDSYNNWRLFTNGASSSFLNFLTGGAGTLYPPDSLDLNIFDGDLFMELSPSSDDVWFWAMAVKNNTKIKVVENNMYKLCYVSPDVELDIFKNNGDDTLWSQNSKGLNDIHINNVLNEFPEILDKIYSEREE